jgi:hypothetical protein
MCTYRVITFKLQFKKTGKVHQIQQKQVWNYALSILFLTINLTNELWVSYAAPTINVKINNLMSYELHIHKHKLIVMIWIAIHP